MIASGLKSDYNLTNFSRTFRVFQTFKWQFLRKRYIRRRQHSPQEHFVCEEWKSLHPLLESGIALHLSVLSYLYDNYKSYGCSYQMQSWREICSRNPLWNCIMNTRKLDLKECFPQNGNKLWRNPNRILNKSNSYTNTASVCILCFFSLSIKRCNGCGYKERHCQQKIRK